MSPSINDPYLIIVSGDSLMAWPLLNSCGSVFFLRDFFLFTRKSLVCLLRRVPETLPTSWNYSILEFYPMQTPGNPKNCCCPKKREREGKKGRYQNHLLDIKTWRKRKKRNNCLFRKPCVSLTLTHKESPLSKTQTKGSGHLAYLLTQGNST